MGLGDLLGQAVSPIAGLMGSLTGADALQGAQEQNALAQQMAIKQEMQNFEQAKQMAQPWMQRGQAALGQIQQSLAPDSRLGNLRSNLARQFMGDFLKRQGFDQRVSGAITQNALNRTGIQEREARLGRIQDVMSLGAGEQAAGMGMVGNYGRSRASDIMAQAAAQGNVLAQQAANQQNMLNALLYSGSRLAGEGIAQRAAERYGGY